MTREEIKVEFTGLAHDHLMVNGQNKQDNILVNGLSTNMADNTMKINGEAKKMPSNNINNQPSAALSTIAILRRHPMYDSLVLTKRYRSCLNGYSLEFPTSEVNDGQKQQTNEEITKECCKTKLVSMYLDGDDPMYQCQENKCKNHLRSADGETVYVPMNGLIDRLDKYERHGVAIDSRVYAFAMGLKTAERFLTSSSMKEIQEAPPL